MTNSEVKEYLITNIINAAIKAGAAVMKIYTHPDRYDISLKSDLSPLTEADRVAHTTIKEALGATRIPILSEEGREMGYEERRNWDLFWLVDPLDGTIEYINRTDEFTINIALMSHNRAVCSVVYVPCLDRLYFASHQQGAFLCDRVKPNADSALAYNEITEMFQRLPLESTSHTKSIVAISRSHNTPETFEHIEALRQSNPDIEIIEQGSSYKFCMLAEGSVDYYVRTSNTYEWDTAAGDLILDEAGGSTRSLPLDEPLQYNKEQLDNPWFVCRGPHCKI